MVDPHQGGLRGIVFSRVITQREVGRQLGTWILSKEKAL